ncbi:MAG TPA: type I methionyl aminopeptidase, partial [bacterium]|nr:type I methionyl aminopeptidase [bacterium]
NYVSKRFPSVELKPGMCLAIEPMLTLGGDEVGTGEDGWTIVTLDGSWAAHFEVTIALLPEGPEILTPLPDVGI